MKSTQNSSRHSHECAFLRTRTLHQDPGYMLQGWKVKTSPVPIKDPYFATLKSNNYLPNALLALDAQLEGYDQVCPITQRLGR